MRKRKHLIAKRRRGRAYSPALSRKKFMQIALGLVFFMALSLIGSNFYNRATAPVPKVADAKAKPTN